MGWLRNLLRRPPLLHVATDVGGGPVVVLIHGIASSSVTYHHVVPLLAGTHRVVAIDLLGFGGSPAPEHARYSLDEHVASLHRTIRSLRLPTSFVLVGHSMGAIIGARYAAEHGRRISRLVLVSPPVYFSPAEIGASRDRAAMGLYYRVYEFLRANKEFTIRAAAQLARLSPIDDLLDVTERSWRPFALSLENTIEAQTTVSDLVRTDVPVHVVYGTFDPLLAPAGVRLLERLRGVTTHRVLGVDHVIRPRMARVIAAAAG
jgi:pimeloyl-ACP methyl ester carboxylesterase